MARIEVCVFLQRPLPLAPSFRIPGFGRCRCGARGKWRNAPARPGAAPRRTGVSSAKREGGWGPGGQRRGSSRPQRGNPAGVRTWLCLISVVPPESRPSPVFYSVADEPATYEDGPATKPLTETFVQDRFVRLSGVMPGPLDAIIKQGALENRTPNDDWSLPRAGCTYSAKGRDVSVRGRCSWGENCPQIGRRRWPTCST